MQLGPAELGDEQSAALAACGPDWDGLVALQRGRKPPNCSVLLWGAATRSPPAPAVGSTWAQGPAPGKPWSSEPPRAAKWPRFGVFGATLGAGGWQQPAGPQPGAGSPRGARPPSVPGLLVPRVTPASCRQQPAANWICLKQELSLQDENNARSSSSCPPGESQSPPKPHHVVAAPAAPQAGS